MPFFGPWVFCDGWSLFSKPSAVKKTDTQRFVADIY